ncbi:MAG: terminase family protein [Candidatus Helarchaeota archaeon]|nr:terminase family protein [Candidatus Helarchaeota archaeon]
MAQDKIAPYDYHEFNQGWRPNKGPQTEILARSEFELLYGGARGGGKTEAGLAWMIEPQYANHPLYKGLVIRKNYDDLSDWIHRAEIFYRGIATTSGNPTEIRFPAGGLIRTGHLKDPTTYTKYIGHEYQKVLIEELTLIPREEDYLKLLASCRSTVPSLKPQMFATTNPGNAGHRWVKKRWVDLANKEVYRDPISGRSRLFIPARVEDNPKLMEVDPSYVKFLESLPEQLMKAWRWGDWDSFEGMFFPMFDQNTMGIEPFTIPEGWKLVGSLDPGWGSPCSFGLQAKDFNGNVYRIFTYYEKSKNPQSHAEDILARIQNFEYTAGRMPDYIISGHDAWAHRDRNAILAHELTFSDIFSHFGMSLLRANVRPGSRVPGWWAWKGLMTQKKWFYFKGFNDALSDEIATIGCDEDHPEDIIDCGNDSAIDDHAIDECRYAILAMSTPEERRSKEEHAAKYRWGAPLPLIEGKSGDARKFWW